MIKNIQYFQVVIMLFPDVNLRVLRLNSLKFKGIKAFIYVLVEKCL